MSGFGMYVLFTLFGLAFGLVLALLAQLVWEEWL